MMYEVTISSHAASIYLGGVPGQVRRAGRGEAEDALGVPQQERAAHLTDGHHLEEGLRHQVWDGPRE